MSDAPRSGPGTHARGAGEACVQLERVARRFERGTLAVDALQDVTLTIRAGERVALMGPSGCGKSTCLNVISGVDRPDAGRALVLGVDLGTAKERELVLLRRRRIGIVF